MSERATFAARVGVEPTLYRPLRTSPGPTFRHAPGERGSKELTLETRTFSRALETGRPALRPIGHVGSSPRRLQSSLEPDLRGSIAAPTTRASAEPLPVSSRRIRQIGPHSAANSCRVCRVGPTDRRRSEPAPPGSLATSDARCGESAGKGSTKRSSHHGRMLETRNCPAFCPSITTGTESATV